MSRFFLSFILILCISLSLSPLYSQDTIQPKLWIKSVSTSDSSAELQLYNNPSQVIHQHQDSTGGKQGKINNHPCIRSSQYGNYYYLTGDSLFRKTDYTIITAYHAIGQDTLQGLWQITKDTNTLLSLNSRKLILGKLPISYSDTNYQIPVVNTTVQNLGKKGAASTIDTLYILKSHENTFKGNFGELLIFEGRMSAKERLKWQSALSLKYSSTMIKSHYLSSQGDTLWNHKTDSLYSAAIAGLGQDTLRGLSQRQSTIYGDNLTLSLIPTQTPIQDHYLVWGHNGKALERRGEPQYLDTIKYDLLSREWKLENHYKNHPTQPLTTLQFDYPQDYDPSRLRLLINRTTDSLLDIYTADKYTPDSITATTIYFNNINWTSPYKQGFEFGFAYLTSPSQDTKDTKGTIAETQDQNNAQDQFTIYPNPSTGTYTLEASLEEKSPVKIRITNVAGKTLQESTLESNNTHIYTGHIEQNGSYLVNLEYNKGKKTIKLIINK